MEILSLSHVQKSFGELKVLRDVTFSVPEHAVFGLIGKNGAGKTTAMKLVLGFLSASSGDITVCGEKVSYGDAKTNRFIGYLPDVPEFYGYMRPAEYLRFCGEIAGLKSGEIKKRSDELLSLVGLSGVNRKIQGFSRGMKQRLGIAQALLSEPRLLICDEPTSALDPIGRKEILDILSLAAAKTTIVFSTHILSDVERICSRIAILDKGTIALLGNLADIKNTYRQDVVRVELADGAGAEKLSTACARFPFISNVGRKDNTLTLKLRDAEANGRELLTWVLSERLPLVKYEVLEPSLEDLFLEVVE